MSRQRTVPCSQGTCGPDSIDCWHTGDPVVSDSVAKFLFQSYTMWGYKILIEVAPSPVDKWLHDRKTAKKKRLKARAKRREQQHAI